MLVATLAVGTVEGSIVVNAAGNVAIEETVSIASAADFQFDAANATITKYVGNNDKVEIPATINGVQVRAIGDIAFASQGGITEVVIPDGVTTIGAEAFLNCPNLKKVTMANSVTSLGELAFFMCENLTYITLSEGLTSIEENTFYGCRSLKSVKIPDSVTEIVSHAFYDCTSLQEITIPKSVTTFGKEIFTGVNAVKIVCEKNSQAQGYAEANGYMYAVIAQGGTENPTVTKQPAATKQPEATKQPSSTKKPTPTEKQEQISGSYTISYVVKGGKISGKKVEQYDGSISIRLPKATRKGYIFDGWYTESSYKNKISVITSGMSGNKTLYAKWTKVKRASKPTISSVKNSKSKQMTVKLKKKVSGAVGYEMVYATNKKCTKNKKTVRFTSTSKKVKNLKKGKTYYVKVRAYKIDSTNARVYGSYSAVKKVTIEK